MIDDPSALVRELRVDGSYGHSSEMRLRNDAADLIEQQAARIAELEELWAGGEGFKEIRHGSLRPDGKLNPTAWLAEKPALAYERMIHRGPWKEVKDDD